MSYYRKPQFDLNCTFTPLLIHKPNLKRLYRHKSTTLISHTSLKPQKAYNSFQTKQMSSAITGIDKQDAVKSTAKNLSPQTFQNLQHGFLTRLQQWTSKKSSRLKNQQIKQIVNLDTESYQAGKNKVYKTANVSFLKSDLTAKHNYHSFEDNESDSKGQKQTKHNFKNQSNPKTYYMIFQTQASPQ